MKIHTSQFKEDIKTVGKQLDSKITFKVNGVTQTLTSEDLNGVTPTFQGAILKSVMKELDIDSNVNIPIGTEVNYQFGVKLENDFEYLDYGNYIVYSSEKQEDTSSYKIICYDKMLYSMKQNEDLGITYPISIRNYINALCTKIGLEFKNKNDEFANFDRVLDKELYVGLDYTYRDILDELAQVTASTICLDNEDKVEIRYINDLTELNEVVGTNININDSIDYKLNSLTLYGRSTQATRSGKNLFTKQGNATPKTDTTFWSSISYTTPESNGWCKVSVDNTNGTATVYANQFTKRNTIDKLEVNKTYSILVEVRNLTMSGSSSTPPYLQLCETAQNSVWQSIQNYNLAIFKETNKAVFQILTKTNFDSSTMDFRNFVSVPKGYKVEFEYRLMVVKGSYTLDTIGEYEPYGVMPSPDYPSPIESVGRKNLFDYSKLNNDNTIQWTAYSNVGAVFRALPIYVGKNKKVYFSTNVPDLKTENAFYAINNINEGSTNTLNVDNSRVVSSNNDGYVYLGVVTNRQYYEDVQNNVYWIMISTDNVEYLPYEHTEISATVTGKNLFDKYGDFTYGSTNNRTSLQSDGTILSTSNFGSNRSSGLLIGNIKSNTDYIISGILVSADGTNIANNAVIQVLTASNTPIKYFYIKTSATKPCNFSFTFNSGENTSFWISLNGWNSTKEGTTNTIFDNIQLEEGTVVTEFEEYKSNSLTIDLQGNELCSLPNGTKDELVIENGEALLIKRVGKVVLDGSENWSAYTSTDSQGNTYGYSVPLNKQPLQETRLTTFALSNQFIQQIRGAVSVVDTQGIYLGSGITMFVKIAQNLISGGTLANFKTWLSTHNVEVLYELAEPETINLGTVEMPHTYNGVSNITNSADTEMIVKYSKGWETINEEYLKDINVNFG